MEEEKTRKGSSSNKSENKEIDKKIEVSNTVELDIIKEDEKKLENEEQELAQTSSKPKINVKPVKNKDTKKKRKIKLNKQMIGIIVIAISCIVITICLAILKIREINSKYKVPEEENAFVSENKKPDDELKYVVGENDTLDYNNIDYIETYIVDGKEISREQYTHAKYGDCSTTYQYIKISGLKDKNVENKINSKIKEYITNINEKGRDGKTYVTSHVMGNYNNILSINVWGTNINGSYIHGGLNFDLTTGNEFKLEDVFIKSASIVNILYTGLCEELAWDMDINYDDYAGNDEEYFKKRAELANMDNRDTSYYEDMIFKLSNWYKNNKGNINFAISPVELAVYNVSIDGNNYTLKIPLSHFKNCVAIYKRFSSTDSLYDNNKYGGGYIPFTKPMSHYSNCLLSNKIEYGKKTSNLFVDVCLSTYGGNTSSQQLNANIENSLKVLSNNLIVEETKKASNNLQNGYILQAEAGVWDYTSSNYSYEVQGYTIPHYRIIFNINESELSIDDYKKNLIYYLEEAGVLPTASSVPPSVNTYLNTQKRVSFPYEERKIYYFDINGNYLGDDIQVIKDTTREVYQPS